jgi:exonuclease III
MATQQFVRVASLNSAGKAAANTQELASLLDKVGVDLIGLQEVKTRLPLKVPGYTWIPGLDLADLPASHLGIGVLVKKQLKGLLTIALRNTEHEILWLKLAGTRNTQDTYICILYCPQSNHPIARRTAFYADLLESCSTFAAKGEVLLIGDFNSHVGEVAVIVPLIQMATCFLNFYDRHLLTGMRININAS